METTQPRQKTLVPHSVCLAHGGVEGNHCYECILIKMFHTDQIQ